MNTTEDMFSDTRQHDCPQTWRLQGQLNRHTNRCPVLHRKPLTFSVSKMKANNAYSSLQEHMRTSKKWTLRFKKLQFGLSLCLLQSLLSLALPTVNWLPIPCAVAGKAGVNKLIFSWKRCSNTHPYQLPHQYRRIPPLNSQQLFLSFPISPGPPVLPAHYLLVFIFPLYSSSITLWRSSCYYPMSLPRLSSLLSNAARKCLESPWGV